MPSIRYMLLQKLKTHQIEIIEARHQFCSVKNEPNGNNKNNIKQNNI